MFARVPANDGVPQVGTIHLYEGKSISDAEAVVFCEATEAQDGWIILSELEYLAFWGGGRVSIDKNTITADGFDTATITAEVHPDLTEITFYHADTGELIATVPVDPATHVATLKVTATTPGVIRIRAGELTVTRLNEVTIHAVETS